MMQAQYDALFYSGQAGRLDRGIRGMEELPPRRPTRRSGRRAATRRWWRSWSASTRWTPARRPSTASRPGSPARPRIPRWSTLRWRASGSWPATSARCCSRRGRSTAGRCTPRLTIKTSSQNLRYPVTVEPKPPIITSAALIQPVEAPASPCGWQVIVFDGTQVPDNQTALLDKFYAVSPNGEDWRPGWRAMCEAIADDLSNPLMSKAGNILGDGELRLHLQHDADPPPGLADGPGRAPARRWRIGWTRRTRAASAAAPSSGPSGRSATSRSASSATGPDTGLEIFKNDPSEASAELDLYFYRQSFGGHYTLGPA